MKKILSIVFLFAVTAVFSTLNVFAQETMKKSETPKPIVAVFRADWCPYCKKLEPVMQELMSEYQGKFDFVVFDVTNEQTTAEAMKLAETKGLSEFFKENKRKSAFVVIFKNSEQIFKAKYDTEKATYIKAFDNALK